MPQRGGTFQASGLQGVIVANSAITRIDPIDGRVYFRGYEVDELAANSTYEEVVFLLWKGRLPNENELADFSKRIAGSRVLPAEVLSVLGMIAPDSNAIDAVALGISALGLFGKRGRAFEDDAISITAKMGTLVAAISRIKQGKTLVPPKDELNLATDFLRMLHGRMPTEADAKLMDRLLILHADHEMTVSTFAARVVASTLADIYSAFGAAIGAFKGPLHAGAGEAVLRMLDEVGEPENVETYLEGKFAKKEKIMGFGHRMFLASNHVTAIMKDYSERTAKTDDERRKLTILLELERQMIERRKIYPNMDFYSGLLFQHLGVPDYLFVPVFAAGRTPGILAHISEQLSNNRLIRPNAQYIGPKTRSYVPIRERKA